MSISVELQRNNLTLAQFLGACKYACKQKGISFDIEREDFEKPYSESNNHYFVKDGKRFCTIDGHRFEEELTETNSWYKSEIYIAKPLQYQTYYLSMDESTCYNEICEFTFDDEKTGHGYYYRLEKNL